MDDIRNTIENYRIITVYGSNETNGVYLKVKYEQQEDGSDVGEPMEFYTGSLFPHYFQSITVSLYLNYLKNHSLRKGWTMCEQK